jgi:hypothetical protein
VKQSKNTKIEAIYFNKKESVFKEWREDSDALLDKACDHDFKNWKGAKFIKDPKMLYDVEELIKDNYTVLKAIYIYYAAKS